MFLGNFLFKKAAGFFTSGSANEEFYRHYGVPEKKMSRLPFSWGYEWYLSQAEKLKNRKEEIRESYGIKKDDFVLLYVGRLAEEKSLKDLLDAYMQIENKNKKIFFVGDGPLCQDFKNYVRENDVQEVNFTGFIKKESLPNFYVLADVFVLPSEHETWGIVVNEAACFGLPIIVSDRVGCSLDLVQDGCNGYVYPAQDVKALASCIKKIMYMPPSERLLFGRKSATIITEWIRNIDPILQISKLVKKT